MVKKTEGKRRTSIETVSCCIGVPCNRTEETNGYATKEEWKDEHGEKRKKAGIKTAKFVQTLIKELKTNYQPEDGTNEAVHGTPTIPSERTGVYCTII